MTGRFTGSMDPARNISTIVPNDAADLSPRPKALWVNEACTLVVMGDDGVTNSLVIDGAGPVDISPRRVMTASTASAGAIKGLWG